MSIPVSSSSVMNTTNQRCNVLWLVVTITLLTTCIGWAQKTMAVSVLEQSEKLYQDGKYQRALDTLEDMYDRLGELNYNGFGGMKSTEAFLTDLYIRTKEIDR